MEYKKGDKVLLEVDSGKFEIIATKVDTIKSVDNSTTLPIDNFDYALKRIDGKTTKKFEPYVYVDESMIERKL